MPKKTKENQSDFILPYNIEMPEGFEFHPGEAKEKDFPNCCPAHFNRQEYLTRIIKKNRHTKAIIDLLEKHPDLESYYFALPEKINKQLSYIDYIIKSLLDEKEWTIIVQLYLSTYLGSYGNLKIGGHIFMTVLINELKQQDFLNTHELNTIINLYELYKGEIPTNNDTINILLNTYKDWLDLFPGDLDVFTEIKEQLSQKLPVLINDGEIVHGLSSNKILTPAEFLEELKKATRILLSLVSHKNIIDQKDSTVDISYSKKNLINAKRELELKSLVLENETDTNWMEISNIINKWIEGEKRYIQEISEYLTDTIDTPPFHTQLTKKELVLIFNRLAKKGIVKGKDRKKWLALFVEEPIGKVFWNINITGSKTALFDIIQRITKRDIVVGDLTPYFTTQENIHTNWRDKTGKLSRIGDLVFKDIL